MTTLEELLNRYPYINIEYFCGYKILICDDYINAINIKNIFPIKTEFNLFFYYNNVHFIYLKDINRYYKIIKSSESFVRYRLSNKYIDKMKKLYRLQKLESIL